ncbi:zinc finger protein [Macleaya cordata]|uniref:Zinc finger protein n=1 Tax=Macleaya cordata TaxID=56857 RepID=A0A200RCS4_MACCD|nr:zinc finger protein [Macleaya cordata]
MELFYNQLAKSSYGDSLKVLEADIQHANALATTIPRAKDGAYLQMKLAYDHVAPLFLFLLQWLDYTCTCLLPRYSSFLDILIYKVFPDGTVNISSSGRKATIREFYAVILPSLEQLQGNLTDLDATMEKGQCIKMFGRMRVEERRKLSDIDLERETECGICMELCAKMVLPNCCHSMCINCYRDWNTRSESCPFCRGSLKRVSSRDLWVLTGNGDFVDTETVAKEELLRFYYYINNLPQDIADNLFFMYYEYLI